MLTKGALCDERTDSYYSIILLTRGALYDERKELVSQLHHRLSSTCIHGITVSSGSQDGLPQLIGIRKGLMLVLRLLPLLEKVRFLDFFLLDDWQNIGQFEIYEKYNQLLKSIW